MANKKAILDKLRSRKKTYKSYEDHISYINDYDKLDRTKILVIPDKEKSYGSLLKNKSNKSKRSLENTTFLYPTEMIRVSNFHIHMVYANLKKNPKYLDSYFDNPNSLTTTLTNNNLNNNNLNNNNKQSNNPNSLTTTLTSNKQSNNTLNKDDNNLEILEHKKIGLLSLKRSYRLHFYAKKGSITWSKFINYNNKLKVSVFLLGDGGVDPYMSLLEHMVICVKNNKYIYIADTYSIQNNRYGYTVGYTIFRISFKDLCKAIEDYDFINLSAWKRIYHNPTTVSKDMKFLIRLHQIAHKYRKESNKKIIPSFYKFMLMPTYTSNLWLLILDYLFGPREIKNLLLNF